MILGLGRSTSKHVLLGKGPACTEIKPVTTAVRGAYATLPLISTTCKRTPWKDNNNKQFEREFMSHELYAEKSREKCPTKL